MTKKKTSSPEVKAPSKDAKASAATKVAASSKVAKSAPAKLVEVKAAPKSSPAPAAKAAPVTKEKKSKAVAAPKKTKIPKVVEADASVEAKVCETQALATTTITATVDVGFGNSLFVRGEGAGLSWEQGLAMVNVSAERWQIVLGGVVSPVVYKFLLNDQQWNIGEDYVAAPGSSTVQAPVFE